MTTCLFCFHSAGDCYSLFDLVDLLTGLEVLFALFFGMVLLYLGPALLNINEKRWRKAVLINLWLHLLVGAAVLRAYSGVHRVGWPLALWRGLAVVGAMERS